MALADPKLEQPGYQVTLTLKVSDVAALWAAAARRGLAAPGATPDDVYDVIGPREDPSLADCIAMLTGPVSVPGCSLDDLEIAEI
jgi:hypothetical protein